MMKRIAAFLVMVVGLTPEVTLPQAWPSPELGPVAVGQYGVACKLYNGHGKVGPPHYRVSDIGKEGVPALTKEQMSLIQRIENYRDTDGWRFKNLWFAWVGSADAKPGTGQFIVFDTSSYRGYPEPCVYSPPGYWVLNERSEGYSLAKL